MKLETVLVVLGIRTNQNNQMPATVRQWPKGRRGPRYQHLSQEQLDEMGDDQTSLWEAEFVDGHYWLVRRVKHRMRRLSSRIARCRSDD